MTIDELSKKLDDSLVEYTETMNAMYEEADHTPATKDDIHNLSREAFYVLNTFKNEIISYLKENQ